MKPPNMTPPPSDQQQQAQPTPAQSQQIQQTQQPNQLPQSSQLPKPPPATLPTADITTSHQQVHQAPIAVTSQPQNQVRPTQLQSVASTIAPQPNQPIVPLISQGPRTITTNQRPGEYLVLLSNPRQPGMQTLRYPIQAIGLNQPNILQGNPALIRSINASQLIRAQTSSSGIMQTQTSQAQTTTMANIQGRHVQIPFGASGPRGQITLPNGQTIIPSMPLQRHSMMTSRATILQQPNLIRGVTQQGIGVHPGVVPASQQLGLGLQPTMIHQPINSSPNFATATAPSQMTPEDALSKGTSFLNSLLTKGEPTKRLELQNMIQALVDGRKNSAEFASDLQKAMNSGVQPQQLVPFLDLLLPHLRQSMNSGVTKLPGIHPPNSRQQQDLSKQEVSSTPSTIASSPTLSPNKVQSKAAAKPKRPPPVPGQKTAYAKKKEAREAKKKEKESLAAQTAIKTEILDDTKKEVEKPARPKADKTKRQDKQKKQEKQLESLSSALRDDDDVNDVAAMGGVNLAEESQRIMASGAELVGTQIRSCKDEPFLDTKALYLRIARKAKEYNLSEPSKEVVTIISHATQERLKTIVERLGMLAEHRSENLKLNPKYEISNDIKGQMKFLAELDRIEKRRYEEQERELLLRVAKSRSKAEDPEQQKLRQKAKDMQRAEQEEVRQREANETALLAIGPRKKMKTSIASSISSISQSNSLKDTTKSSELRSDSMRRLKRVNMRDLQVLFELDRTNMDRLIKITSQ